MAHCLIVQAETLVEGELYDLGEHLGRLCFMDSFHRQAPS